MSPLHPGAFAWWRVALLTVAVAIATTVAACGDDDKSERPDGGSSASRLSAPRPSVPLRAQLTTPIRSRGIDVVADATSFGRVVGTDSAVVLGVAVGNQGREPTRPETPIRLDVSGLPQGVTAGPMQPAPGDDGENGWDCSDAGGSDLSCRYMTPKGEPAVLDPGALTQATVPLRIAPGARVGATRIRVDASAAGDVQPQRAPSQPQPTGRESIESGTGGAERPAGAGRTPQGGTSGGAQLASRDAVPLEVRKTVRGVRAEHTPALLLNQSVPQVVSPGVTYDATFSVQNVGGGPAGGPGDAPGGLDGAVAVERLLPPGLASEWTASGDDWSCSGGADQPPSCKWTQSTLALGATTPELTIRFTVRADHPTEPIPTARRGRATQPPTSGPSAATWRPLTRGWAPARDGGAPELVSATTNDSVAVVPPEQPQLGISASTGSAKRVTFPGGIDHRPGHRDEHRRRRRDEADPAHRSDPRDADRRAARRRRRPRVELQHARHARAVRAP